MEKFSPCIACNSSIAYLISTSSATLHPSGWQLSYRWLSSSTDELHSKATSEKNRVKVFNFCWGRTWFTAVSTAAGEGSKINGSASTQHGMGSESCACSSHLNLKKKKKCERWWVFLLFPFCTEVYGLQSVVQITARAGISKGNERWDGSS